MGQSQEVLNKIYKTYIKPVLKYSSETIITASSNNINKLEHLQNNSLKLITGCIKTTPATALQVKQVIQVIMQ